MDGSALTGLDKKVKSTLSILLLKALRLVKLTMSQGKQQPALTTPSLKRLSRLWSGYCYASWTISTGDLCLVCKVGFGSKKASKLDSIQFTQEYRFESIRGPPSVNSTTIPSRRVIRARQLSSCAPKVWNSLPNNIIYDQLHLSPASKLN